MARSRQTPIQISNPYKARACKTADQNLTDATWGQLTFPTETYDTNNNFASNAYTVPVTGWYQVNFSTTLISSTAKGVAYQSQIQKNGAAYWMGLHQPYPATTTYTSANFGFADLIYLVAGDVITAWAYVDTVDASAPSSIGTNGSTFISFELRATL